MQCLLLVLRLPRLQHHLFPTPFPFPLLPTNLCFPSPLPFLHYSTLPSPRIRTGEKSRNYIHRHDLAYGLEDLRGLLPNYKYR